MTSIVGSAAHFDKCWSEMGLSDRSSSSLRANGYTTLGKLAFTVGQPGVPLNETECQAFATNVLGPMAPMADSSTLKRLLFESHTMLLSQLREQVSNPGAGLARKLPTVEREAKMVALNNRLPGLIIERQLEPSHALLELVSQQRGVAAIAVYSEKCSSRELEITRPKTAKQLSIDSDRLLIKRSRSRTM